jgi:hypothetical protein
MRIILLLIFIIGTFAKCPGSPGEALMCKPLELVECDATTLRNYYNENDCCIVNIAECNNIEAAWQLRRNVLSKTRLCSYIRGGTGGTGYW